MAVPALAFSSIPVKMCEIEVIRGAGTLVCPGLGSCVAIIGYDPNTQVGGMAHVMLPKSFAENNDERPARFADLALPAFLKCMEQHGAQRSRIRLALVGGAHVLRLATSSQMDIGARNGATLLDAVKGSGLRLVDQDLGGLEGRTVTFTVGDGQVTVRKMAQSDKVLCSLKA